MTADFIAVPTVELLTRAAGAAGNYASRQESVLRLVAGPNFDPTMGDGLGPDHWRAVETLIRQMLKLHDQTADRWCLNPVLNRPYGQPVEPCPALEALRPLAEQVLQHLGDTA